MPITLCRPCAPLPPFADGPRSSLGVARPQEIEPFADAVAQRKMPGPAEVRAARRRTNIPFAIERAPARRCADAMKSLPVRVGLGGW